MDASLDRVAEVEARSASFRRELGLATLALTQIMYVVGSGWVGTAAKLGPSHVDLLVRWPSCSTTCRRPPW